MPHSPVPPRNRDLARGMRSEMPDAEFRLWCALRGRGLGGMRFRRQQPIGPFTVDFFCPEKRLIVEVDGEQHALGRQPEADLRRTEWLRAQENLVLRFWTNEVMDNLDAVCAAILAGAEGRWRNSPNWDG